MKINLINIGGVALVTTAVGMSSAFAQNFGPIPGAAANAYGNTDQNTSEYTVTTVNGDTLTLAQQASPHDSGSLINATPGNNGAGTYFVAKGFGNTPGRSTWDFDFYASSSQGALSDYTFTLTVDNLGNGLSHPFDPSPSFITDDVGTPGSTFGNEETLDFAFAGAAINYNPNLADTYTFTLTADEGGVQVASDTITVVSAPDSGSTLGLAGLGLAAIAFARRRLAVRA